MNQQNVHISLKAEQRPKKAKMAGRGTGITITGEAIALPPFLIPVRNSHVYGTHTTLHPTWPGFGFTLNNTRNRRSEGSNISETTEGLVAAGAVSL